MPGMTPERIAEIKNRNLDSLSGDAPYNPDVWDLVADRDALLAEVERLKLAWSSVAEIAARRQSELIGRREHAEKQKAEVERLKSGIQRLHHTRPGFAGLCVECDHLYPCLTTRLATGGETP